MEQAFENDISILEIGGNIGTLAHRIFEAGYKNIYSTDIAPSAIAYGKSVYPELRDRLLVASQGQLPFPAHSFDLVMSFDVVEHLPDVDAHFQEVKRLLKADGRYIFQTPNKITNIPWEIIDSRSLSDWKTLHCSLHTRGQLARRIENNGFRGAILKRNLATEYNQEKIRNRLGVAGLSLLKLVDRLPAQFSTNFWVVCSPVGAG
jgi:SAM-dependent methyltransferase